jgi:HK97 family phage prohead protease
MIERRVLPSLYEPDFEVRASKRADGKSLITGYAARYGILSGKIPSGSGFFRERIQTGAFDRVLRSKPDVVALFNHDVNFPLGRTTSGTLRLRADDKGLGFECHLPDTSYARDLHTSVERGDMNGCSFAFNLGQGDDDFDEEDTDEGRCVVRSILNFSGLYDVSVVTHPAYPGTNVDARNIVAPVELRSRLATRSVRTEAARRKSHFAEAVEEYDVQSRRRSLMNFILS